MNAATISTSPAWQKLEQEVREHKLTETQFTERLKTFAKPTGIAAPVGTKAPPPAVAGSHAEGTVGKVWNGLEDLTTGFGLGTKVQNGIENAAEGARSALGIPTPGGLASEVGEDLIGVVTPVAKKLTLYAVLILGAVAMMIYGLSKLLEPIGGPNLKSALAGAARAGAAA